MSYIVNIYNILYLYIIRSWSFHIPVFNGRLSFLFSCRQGPNSSCLAIKIHRLHCQMSELSMTLGAFGFWPE